MEPSLECGTARRTSTGMHRLYWLPVSTPSAGYAPRLDIPAIQAALQQDGLDAWLLYDFHGSNPIAARVAGVGQGAHMATRRWYYLIPAEGAPRGLVHAIERHNLDALPGHKEVYAGRDQLDAGLALRHPLDPRVGIDRDPLPLEGRGELT